MTTFKITEITTELNGYGMPIIRVSSDTNLKVINRGYNEYECIQQIDETDLLQLRTKFSNVETVMLEITTPERKTNCWYALRDINFKSSPNQSNIMW